MKNLKKLLAVIVAICVLATFTVPAFAEETTAAKTDAEIATELGVILGEGGGVTADYLASQPTRLQGAIMFLRLKGLEGAAKAFTGTDNFEDVSVVNDTNKAILAYLKANPDLGFQGVGNNTFAPLKEMTAKEYYKILLVALGYEENTDFTWANVLSFAAGKGLTKLIDNEKFTVNDLCVGTVEALKANVKGGTETLIAKLVEGNSISSDKAIASGLYNPVAKVFEVVSATADNLKVAKFAFSKEVNGDTVKKENFTIKGVSVSDAKLLDDKKTVYVILTDKATQNEAKDILVKNVKSADGATITEVTKTVTFIDTTIPTITGVVAKNAKSIVVTASEPLDANNDATNIFDDIKLDGASTGIIATSSVDYVKNTVTFNLTTSMAKGAHKVEIAKLKDYAGYVAVTQTFNIDVPEDTTAPAIASAKVKSNTSVEVTFNEDVDFLYQGSFKVNGRDVYSAVQGTDKAVFTLTLASGQVLDIGATVEIKVEYKGQKDVTGNEVKDLTAFTFKVADDTTLPTASVSVESDNTIKITFSKAMTENVGTVKVSKSDDTLKGIVTLSVMSASQGEWNDDSTVLSIKPAATGLTTADPTDLKVNLKDMKDATVRMNVLPETTLTLKSLDTSLPTVAEYFTVNKNVESDEKDDTITFTFSEAVNADTAKNLSNYEVVTAGSVTLTEKQTLSAYGSKAAFSSISSDGKKVTLKVESIANSGNSGMFIKVYAIKDVAGNMMASTSNIVALATGVGPVISTVNATSKNTIEVVFQTAATDKISFFSPGAFVVKKNGTFFANVIATSIDNDNNKVKLTIGGDMGTTTSGPIQLVVNNKDYVYNAYGDKIADANGDVLTVNDKIKPTVTASVDDNSSGTITVKFSEDVKTTTAALKAEIVLTKDGSRVDVDEANFTYYDADGITVVNPATTAFRKVVITLEGNKIYKFQFYAGATGSQTIDLYTNKVADVSDAVTLTTLP